MFKVGDRVKCTEFTSYIYKQAFEEDSVYVVSNVDVVGWIVIEGYMLRRWDPANFVKVEYSLDTGTYMSTSVEPTCDTVPLNSGDKVKCIDEGDGSTLILNCVYEVEHIYNADFIKLKGFWGSYKREDFVMAKPEEITTQLAKEERIGEEVSEDTRPNCSCPFEVWMNFGCQCGGK